MLSELFGALRVECEREILGQSPGPLPPESQPPDEDIARCDGLLAVIANVFLTDHDAHTELLSTANCPTLLPSRVEAYLEGARPKYKSYSGSKKRSST